MPTDDPQTPMPIRIMYHAACTLHVHIFTSTLMSFFALLDSSYGYDDRSGREQNVALYMMPGVRTARSKRSAESARGSRRKSRLGWRDSPGWFASGFDP